MEAKWLNERSWGGSGAWQGKPMDFKSHRDTLEGTLGGFDVGIELMDVILQAFDPSLLLGET